MVLWSVHRRDTPGPRVQFACPACLAPAAAGESYERHETFRALHLIPLFFVRNTYVMCGTCHAHLLSQLTLDDLRQHANSDISPFLSFSISFVAKALSVLAILLCWFPFLGIAFGRHCTGSDIQAAHCLADAGNHQPGHLAASGPWFRHPHDNRVNHGATPLVQRALRWSGPVEGKGDHLRQRGRADCRHEQTVETKRHPGALGQAKVHGGEQTAFCG